MFKSFFLLLFLAFNLGLIAQNEDSLLINKIDSAFAIARINLDSGIIAVSAVRDLAAEMKDDVQRGRSEHYLGICYRQKGEIAEALRRHFVSRQIFENLNDSAHVVGSNFEIGTCYASLKMYDKALEYYFSTLLYYGEGKGIQQYRNTGGLHVNIGGVYQQLKDYEKAEEHLRIGRAIAIELKDTIMIQSATSMMSWALYRLNNDSTEFYLNECEQLFRLKPNSRAEIFHYMNLGAINQALPNPEKARDAFNKAYLLASKHGDTFG